MKTFNHIKHDLPSLKRINEDGKRLYNTPDGKSYPSVTTITSSINEESIKKWRKKVGEQEANKISNRACQRGTSVHSLCENYLLNNHVQTDIFDQENFDVLKPYLERIDNIHALESKMYSHTLEVAGTVDCIAEFDGNLYVIDFKTSRKPKKPEYIHNYFMQCSAYAYMFYEHTGILIKELLILISVDDNEPQIFIEPTDKWLKEFVKIRKEFKEKNGY